MPGKAPIHSDEWKDRYADNKRKDYMLMQVTRIADALERAYPPPSPEPFEFEPESTSPGNAGPEPLT